MKRFSSLLLTVVFLVFSSVSAEELGIFHRGAAAALGVAELLTPTYLKSHP